MTHQYSPDDLFYDVESLTNVFTVAWYYPERNMVILTYLDDDHIIKSQQDLDYITQYIYHKHPNLKAKNTRIVYENIKYRGRAYRPDFGNMHPIGGIETFAQRLGLANINTYLNQPKENRGRAGGGNQYDPCYFPVKDTDPDYNPNIHGYRFGYNSTNYDLTILAYLLGDMSDENFKSGNPNSQTTFMNNEYLTARTLRDFNDELFEPEFKSQMPSRLAVPDNPAQATFNGMNYQENAWILRKAWLLTGRYIDVSRLNEKLQKVGLKRLLGMLGLQIMESDKLSNNTVINNLEEMADLLAYNIADVVNLQTLFEHKVYQNAFTVRGALLKTYPQVVYAQDKSGAKYPGASEAKVDETDNKHLNIRKDRLTRDSTSAKFVELALAPYSPIKDIETVSFMYPSERDAKKLGVTPTNILEDSKAFFEKTVTSDPEHEAHKDFMEVYRFYKSIEGKNFNVSDIYQQEYAVEEEIHVRDEDSDNHYSYMEPALPEHLIPKDRNYIKQKMNEFNTNLFYYKKDPNGNVTPTSCAVNFSIGGIHGVEMDQNLYNQDRVEYEEEQAIYDYVMNLYDNDPILAINGPVYIDLPSHLSIPDNLKAKVTDKGIKIREFLKSGSTKTKAAWKEPKPVILYKAKASGAWEIVERYRYVSNGPARHKDFASYYPLLISRLSIFINPSYHGTDDNGEAKDPYYEMYIERKIKKDESRDPNNSPEHRQAAHIEQDSRKLLINAASGAGDATFHNNIRANNAIISMRIIGQLFAWRIGQAESAYGARVPSTNTDGLYTTGLPDDLSDKILNDTVKDMYIDIDPEPLDRFVSKDSNNRIEVLNREIQAASGGTLTSWSGPEPVQSLDHAAIIDRILAKYLAHPSIQDPTTTPFDYGLARQLFDDFLEEYKDKPQQALRFFQWILASSSGTHRYYYAAYKNKETGETTKIESLQQYNRIFLTKAFDPTIIREMRLATRRAIPEAKFKKLFSQYNKGEILKSQVYEHNKESLEILKTNGLDVLEENNNHNSEHYRDQATVQKVKTMPNDQHVEIYNHSLLDLSDQQAHAMLKTLDIDAYMSILANAFLSWTNLSKTDALG